MKFLNSLILLFCIFLTPAILAQSHTGSFKNYRHISTASGLPSNSIRSIQKGPEGFTWLATSNGLVKYDGSEFTIFKNIPGDTTSLSGNEISVIKFEGDSILWVGTFYDGLNKLDLKTNKFKRFIPRSGNLNSIPSKEIYALEHDLYGHLWIGYNRDGFGRFDRKTNSFEQIKLTYYDTEILNRQVNVIKNFVIDAQNKDKIWIVSLQALIEYDLKTGRTQVHPVAIKPNEKPRVESINQGIMGRDQKIYLTLKRHGIWVFDPKTIKWENFSMRPANPGNQYDNSFDLIHQTDDNTMWMAAQKSGLYQLNIVSGKIKPLFVQTDFSNEDPPQNISAWNLNAPEGMWFATDKGIKLFNKQANQFKAFKFDTERAWLKNRLGLNAVYPINDDEIYCGGHAGEGIYRLNIKTGEKKLIPPPWEIKESSQNLFYLKNFIPYNDSSICVLTSMGLFILDLNTEKITEVNTGLKYEEDYYILNRIMALSDGHFLISSRHSGVFELNRDLKVMNRIIHDPQRPTSSLVSSGYIFEMCEDPDKNIWIGTEDGFSKWNRENGKFLNFDYRQRNDSIPSLRITYGIKLAPDSSLWFIDAKDHAVKLKYPYTEPWEFYPVMTGNNGLKDRLNNVLFSGNGQIILSTAAGISIIDKQGDIKRYTEKEGLPKLSPLTGMAQMPDGRIILAERSEIIAFYPDSLHYTPKKNKLYLSSLSVFDNTLTANGDSLLKNGLKLSYLENFFTINLSVLNFDNPDEYKVNYRLKGLNDEWITSSVKNAVFTNVPGGKYVFEARLIDKNNEISPQILSLPIEMVAPFWKTTAFKLLIFGISAIILAALILARMHTLRRKAEYNKQLANLELVSLRAQMNPHFIFNSLNSIRHQIIMQKNEAAAKHLVKFSRLVRWILENSENHYILLTDELEALELYVELETKRFENKFEYEVNVDKDIDINYLKVPPLFIQPFVENAIWHGIMQKKQNGKVRVDISRKDKNLMITITDDGIGREKAELLKSKTGMGKKSMGMKIATARLDSMEKLYNISCRAEVIDLKDNDGNPLGTKVIITLPLITSFKYEK